MNLRFLQHIGVLLLISQLSFGQQQYAGEIAAFKRADSLSGSHIGLHPIVFVGSSSFRMWPNLESVFPGKQILNRGFGGSTFTDVIHYASDIIIKYNPSQVLIYCGENDLALADSLLPIEVFERFKSLFFIIRKDLPNTNISFVSIKPSPVRKSIQVKVLEANGLIKEFLKNKKETAYIDVYFPMLNANGTMREELFVADGLHLNEQGYAIWQKIIEPYLLK